LSVKARTGRIMDDMFDASKPIESSRLQKQLSDRYRSFFLDHEIVVSADFSLPLTPGLAWQAGAPEVFLKLPRRAYVGVRFEGKAGSVKIGTCQVYDVLTDTFHIGELELPAEAVQLGLEQHLSKMFPHTPVGCVFDFLFEGDSRSGIHAPTASLLISLMHLAFGERSQEIADVSGALWKEIHVDALKLRSACSLGVAHGTKEYAGMVRSSGPVVYVAQERQGSIERPVDGMFPLDVSQDRDRLDDLHWWGWRLEDFGANGAFPLDVAMLYQEGITRDHVAVATHMRQSVIPGFDHLRTQALALFRSILDVPVDQRPFFLKETSDGAYIQQFLRGHALKHIELLRRLLQLYQQPLDTGVAFHMLEMIDSVLNTHAPFVELPSEETQHVMRQLKQRADELGIPIAIRALHWGKQDGNLCVYTRTNTFREALLQLVAEYSELKQHRVCVDFLSWRDGFGVNGFMVDQDVARGKISPILEDRVKRLTTWDRRHGYRTKLLETQIPSQIDVVFDASTRRVEVAGVPLTSQDIPSQKATVELCTSLFKQIGTPVQGRTLPCRTYSGYRNELQGKIFGPLEAVVQSRCHTSLGISIHGSLTDFEVLWDPKSIRIGVIEDLS
jgi:hypothetical protein